MTSLANSRMRHTGAGPLTGGLTGVEVGWSPRGQDNYGDLQMQYGEEIGVAIGVVLAAALALQTALGPAVATIVEAVKSTGLLPPGWSGVISLGSGLVLGTASGVVAWHQRGDPWWLFVGAFAGLLVGAGGVTAHQNQVGVSELRRERHRRKTVETVAQETNDEATG